MYFSNNMDIKLIFCVVMTAVGSFPLISCSPVDNALVPQKNVRAQFQGVRNMFKNIAANRTLSPQQIKWDPDQSYDPFYLDLCSNNPSCNYQNPFDCTQFIMCSNKDVFIWTCPDGGYYDAFADLCGYAYPPPAETCPWPSAWQDPFYGRCDLIGQRPWWGLMTLPVNPFDSCGSDVLYCFRYGILGYDKCPPGYGYCKAFLACLPVNICTGVDGIFGLLK